MVSSEEPPLFAYLELLPPRRGRELSPRQPEVFLKEIKVAVKMLSCMATYTGCF